MDIETKEEFNKVNERLNSIENRLDGFATKADLNNFATKDDLKSFATKEDLKRLATKDDLNNFVTKDDLKAALQELPTRADFNKLQQSVDGLAKISLDYFQETKIIHAKVLGIEKWIGEASPKIGVKYNP